VKQIDAKDAAKLTGLVYGVRAGQRVTSKVVEEAKFKGTFAREVARALAKQPGVSADARTIANDLLSIVPERK
jgi:hypothetical protein